MKKMWKIVAVMCVLIFTFALNCQAKTTINEDFENTTLTNILGGGLFGPASSAGYNDLEIATENKGTYINKFLQVKPSDSQKVLLTALL